MINIALWTVLSLQITGILISVAMIGKQRKPSTPATVALSMAITAVPMTLVLLALIERY